MSVFNRLTAILVVAAMLGPVVPVQARTKKGDKFLSEGRSHEAKKEWDAALEQYEQALSEDPAEMVYQMSAEKARFQAAQRHVDAGLRIRAEGQLGDALIEFQKAYAINPGSAIAVQELQRTQEMILRERKRVEDTGKEATPEQRGMTPVEEARKNVLDRIRRMQPVPELRPLNREPINLKINNQPVKVLYETIGKVAGINVLWDPEYQSPARNAINVEFNNSTIEEALDYLSVITKSYWKPLSPNTIFITNDNPNKRRDYAEMVAKTFYLQNVNSAQELQEVVNAVRSVSELQRVVAYNSQNAIIVRGEADQVSLAEKMIQDLDKPKSEVVVDIMVMEASTVFSRKLTAAIAATGLNIPITFNPRASLQYPGTGSLTGGSTTGSSGSGSTTGSGSTGDTGSGSSTSGSSGSATPAGTIPLSNLGKVDARDFSITLPNALLQAAMSDTKTKVLEAPQIRSVDNVKAVLKIGERQPTATGSFQPGIGGVGINPLVNTQFTYIDVGVNVEITPRVHENGDVSMVVDLDISSVTGQVNLGGISQPIIGQRKVSHAIRMHEGEVNLLGGLLNSQENKQITGIPGLSSIPLLRRLFTGESIDKSRDDLMIVLIPHIVRRPDLNPENIRAISVGNAQTIKLNYAAAPDGATVPARPGGPRAEGQNPGAPAAGNPPAAAVVTPVPGTPGAPATATSPPVTAPQTTGPPVTVPGINAPPATAPAGVPNLTPPATAPPATAPPATAPPAPAPSPGGAARLRFTPFTVEAAQGSTVIATLVAENVTDAVSVPIQIKFDPKVLRLNDVVPGQLLASDGQPPQVTRNIQNDSGTAVISIARNTATPGVSGSGAIVTLTFQAVGKGTTAVEAPGITIRNADGEPVATASLLLPVTIK
jgi:general secretion pathway protein D